MHLFLSVLLPYSRIHSMNRMMLFNFFGWIELNVSWKWLTSMRHSWMQSHFACGDHHWWHLWVTISPITKKLRVECRKVFSIFGCKRCLRQSSRERSTWIHKKRAEKIIIISYCLAHRRFCVFQNWRRMRSMLPSIIFRMWNTIKFGWQRHRLIYENRSSAAMSQYVLRIYPATYYILLSKIIEIEKRK